MRNGELETGDVREERRFRWLGPPTVLEMGEELLRVVVAADVVGRAIAGKVAQQRLRPAGLQKREGFGKRRTDLRHPLFE